MPRPKDPTDTSTARREAHAQEIRRTAAWSDIVEHAETSYGPRAAAGSLFARLVLRASRWALDRQHAWEAEARIAARATYDRPRRRD